MSGDDEGVVKVWDIRANSVAMEYEECEDFISGFAYNAKHRTLLVTRCGIQSPVLNTAIYTYT